MSFSFPFLLVWLKEYVMTQNKNKHNHTQQNNYFKHLIIERKTCDISKTNCPLAVLTNIMLDIDTADLLQKVSLIHYDCFYTFLFSELLEL